MKIGIYNEPRGGGIGGSETMAAVLAEALTEESHQVDFIHHVHTLSAIELARVSGTNLKRIRLRYVEAADNSDQYFRNPRRRYQASRSWHASLSQPYDIFVAVVHEMPPFCHAARGALVVLFPFHTARYIRPPEEMLTRRGLRRRIENFYQKWEWKKRMESYQLKTAISEFSRLWTQRRWGIDCEILAPPVATCFHRAEKEPVILSVGRFAVEGQGHTKKQLEMLTSFREMKEAWLQGWEYFCVGGLPALPENQAYFKNLSDLGAGCQAHLLANLERDALRSLYQRARIFWHAAGYGEDEDLHPELTEHFGISTVEAMAAGCVPVVINKGGQREIVRHGVDGFLWNTLEELKEYTEMLVRDDALSAKMSEAARARAQLFSREAVVDRFLVLLRPLLAK